MRSLRVSTFFVTFALSALGACADDATRADVPPDGARPVHRWSDPKTWPARAVPAAGAEIVIPAGMQVLLDVSPPPLASLTIEGRLVFDDRDLELTVGWVLVRGALEVGTEARPFRHRATLTLTEGGEVPGMGVKVIGVMGGQLDLHGEPRLAWSRLRGTAARGATQITLDVRPDWRAGDVLVIASTEFDPARAEVVVVRSVSGNTVTLERPLEHGHWGEAQEFAGRTFDSRAEVGLLSRNVVVRGDSASLGSGIGAHVMIMGGQARVSGVQIHRGGQAGRNGRYPLHWHMVGDGSGSYARGNSIWASFSRCVTIHGTSNVRLERNVAYDTRGHCYFLEDGAETGNVLEGNLGLGTRRPPPQHRLLASDDRPATYWVTNPDNTLVGNVAAGSEGFGFWYALPEHPTGLSATTAVRPRRVALREFRGNVAHSNLLAGLNVDDGPRPDGTTETTSYQPRQSPSDDASPAAVAEFRDFTAYKHRGRAVWLRGREHRLVGAMLVDNGIGATFASSESFLEDAVLVGESANNAIPLQNFPIRGYEFYDGRVGARRVAFVNFRPNATRWMSAIGFNRANGFPVSTLNSARELRFVDANPVYLEDPRADRDGDKAAVILDEDGSLTGTPGHYVAARSPILVTPACGLRREWNAYSCAGRFVRLSLRSEGGAAAVAPLEVQRGDGARESFVGVPGRPSQVDMSLPAGHLFALRYLGATPDRPRLHFSGMAASDWVRVSIPFAAPPGIVWRDGDRSRPLPAATSIAELDASVDDRFLYAGGLLHLKVVARQGRSTTTISVDPR